jgi:hypothetical protein
MTNQALKEMNKKRKIVQICYVTRDYKRTIRYLYDKLNIGPWNVMTLSEKNTTNVQIDGNLVNESYEFIVCHSMLGDMQLEVIQPVSGPSAYTKYLDEHGEGLHHIKEKVDGNELPDIVAEYEKKGVKNVFSGGFDIDRFVYLDTEDAVGAAYEIGNQPDLILPSDQFSVWPEEK